VTTNPKETDIFSKLKKWQKNEEKRPKVNKMSDSNNKNQTKN
jgi:hypothetical protein